MRALDEYWDAGQEYRKTNEQTAGEGEFQPVDS
jgi:hypothetical protein